MSVSMNEPCIDVLALAHVALEFDTSLDAELV